jgi:hypothetical protein
MVPVVLLAINTGTLSTILFCLTMTGPFLNNGHIPAIYLTIIVLRTLALIAIEEAQSAGALSNTIDVAQVAHLALSLLINILATSIIALKAWCVRVDRVFRKHFVDRALINNTMRMYIQEIRQVANGKRNRFPIPNKCDQDISPAGRVGHNSHSEWRKHCLGVQARVVTAFLSLQVIGLISITVFLKFGLGQISTIILPVAIQLVVRNRF